jgi:hypothetical protein
MTNSGVVDLDSNFVGLWGRDLDILDAQFLASFPGHGGLAGNGLYTESCQLCSPLTPRSRGVKLKRPWGRQTLPTVSAMMEEICFEEGEYGGIF